MQDRGDKIVTLAREILRAEALPTLPETSTQRIVLTFKMLCFTTVLAAVGASAVTYISAETQRPLNHYERTELDALVFYTAHHKNIGEDLVRAEVLNKLQLSSFDKLTERQYSAARDYLYSQLD